MVKENTSDEFRLKSINEKRNWLVRSTKKIVKP